VTGIVLAVLIAISATVVAAVQRSACRPDPDQRPGRARRRAISQLERALTEGEQP
jgi:hypothetical protein